MQASSDDFRGKPRTTSMRGKRVTVMGLGLHGGGEGVVRFLVNEGAKVLVTDLKTEKELAPTLQKLNGSPVEYVLGRHRSEDFITANLVIQNPGVPDDSPYLELARKNRVPIDTDIGIFFEHCPGFIVGITGTKGKSTVATLTHNIFRAAGIPSVLAGNIRVSVLSVLGQISQSTVTVLELSSWQLEGLARRSKSPHAALITNVLPDHLNRYKNFQSYRDAKALIFAYQGPEDILVLNANDEHTNFFIGKALSRIVLFAPEPLATGLETRKAAARVRHGAIFLGEEKILQENELPVQNKVFAANVLAGAALAWAATSHSLWPHGGVAPSAMAKAIKSFRPLSGRLERIAELKDVVFVNDTCATMPDAAIAALESFPQQKIILIAGGMDKNLDYGQLADAIAARAKRLVLFAGDASEKISAALKALGKTGMILGSGIAAMDEAVQLAFTAAEAGDIIVLSPGAASFNLFANEFDRGEQFVRAVRALNFNIKNQNVMPEADPPPADKMTDQNPKINPNVNSGHKSKRTVYCHPEEQSDEGSRGPSFRSG